jgi:S1-C subfamily serine protease
LELSATLDRRPANFDRSDFQNRMGGAISDRRAGFPIILQHDTVLQPKDCGGPLVDLDGHIIGINIARAGRVETYAIPAEAVQPLLADLMSGKLAPKAQSSSLVLPEERVSVAKAQIAQLETQKAEIERRLTEARTALVQAEVALKAQKEAEARAKEAEAEAKAKAAAEAKAKEAEKNKDKDKK